MHTHTHNTNLKSCSRGSLRTVCAENDQYLYKRLIHGLSNYRWTYVGVLQTNIWKTSKGAWLYNCEIEFLPLRSLMRTTAENHWKMLNMNHWERQNKWHSTGQIKQVNRCQIVYLRFGPMPEKQILEISYLKLKPWNVVI